MSESFTVQADPRQGFGKNNSRRLRRSGKIPAVVYGGGGPAIPVALDPKAVIRILHSEAGHNAIFTLEVKGKAPARVMLRDWQLEPVHEDLLHVDLVRVALDTQLKVRVPIHITGEPQGVKLQGGIFELVMREVEIECLPDDIPDNLTVDVSELLIGKSVRVSELSVSSKVKVLSDADHIVAHVIAPRAEEEKPAAEAAEAAPAEPELIRKRKPEEEEAGAEGAGEKEAKREAKKEGGKES
jgi:large subunit ribosomal protein L25